MSIFRPELPLKSPWLNCAGTLGFTPPAHWLLPEQPGAFVTNPISRKPRTPAGERTTLSGPGWYLLHTGLANPGFSSLIRQYSQRWAHSDLPIWVHLIVSSPAEAAEMVQRLENLEGVSAIELALPPKVSGDQALQIASAGCGELPVLVALPCTSASEPWVEQLARLPISGLTLHGPRGRASSGADRSSAGRYGGPAVLPLVMEAVHNLKNLDVPLIAAAGVYQHVDAAALLAEGASAVELDAVLWRGWAEETLML